MKSDVYKNAENYYKSVFENAGGSINFYPDKEGSVPTADNFRKEVSEISVQTVKDFCKRTELLKMYSLFLHLVLYSESIILRINLFSLLFIMAEMIPDFLKLLVCS